LASACDEIASTAAAAIASLRNVMDLPP